MSYIENKREREREINVIINGISYKIKYGVFSISDRNK